MPELSDDQVLQRLAAFRQYQHDGKRAPHKPLLVMLALGTLQHTGTSAVPWSTAERKLAELIADFGPPSKTGRAQSAAYPFTRLRRDDIWLIDADVPDDNLTPLRESAATGRLEASLEAALRDRPILVQEAARRLVERHFPMTVAPDVLTAVGLDPDAVLAVAPGEADERRRKRSSSWPKAIIAAWDRQCAFCGYDGQLGASVVGIEAAHVRWFNLGGPDSEDNGLALCSLHHKLYDRGAIGLDQDHRIHVSGSYSARTESAKRIYDLHDKQLRPRRGTVLPGLEHIAWHTTQVFKGESLSA